MEFTVLQLQNHTPFSFAADIALLNQQQSQVAAVSHSGSVFPVAPVGGIGSLGNLSSAMLSASSSSNVPGVKPLGMIGSESLMSAYLGMPPANPQQPQLASC